jgi:hypothetical protein
MLRLFLFVAQNVKVALQLKHNGPAIKLVGVVERVEVVSS